MIPYTRPYMPDRAKLDRYIDGLYESAHISNNGPLVQELSRRLEKYLGVDNLLLVANGTLALQIAFRALGLKCQQMEYRPEVITTPFSFIATASSLEWEGFSTRFADIEPDSLCLSPRKIEERLTSATRAIVPVHVFGNPCDVSAIEDIAHKNGLKTVYDAAHAFGVDYRGESILKWGDAATLSFHATKVFHTIEGGAIVFKRSEDKQAAARMINFGMNQRGDVSGPGINAKMNEFQAAMGLCVLDGIDNIFSGRRRVFEVYENELACLKANMPEWKSDATKNFAYFPIVFDSPGQVEKVIKRLGDIGVCARRYFHPSLDQVMGNDEGICEVSEDISKRILCLPVYSDLEPKEVRRIGKVVREAVT